MVNVEEIKYLSSDGEHEVYAKFLIPNKKIKGILQICHGMNGYIAQYDDFAKNFLKKGYIVCGNTSIGHWDSVKTKNELGFFGEFDGFKYLIKDTLKFTEIIKNKFPEQNIILFGHSMGSFIARCCTIERSNNYIGAIYSGTAGPQPLANSGIQFANSIIQMKGYRYRSRKLYKVLFQFANRKIENPDSKFAWVKATKDNYEDKKTDFLFTVTGLRDILNLIKKCNSVAGINKISKDFPIYFFAGTEDPVGEYGEGVKRAFKLYQKAGLENVSCTLYEGDRHECFNEKNGKEVIEDILNWINENCTRGK